jgi:hypothetical protein
MEMITTKAIEVLYACGHENVQSSNKTTFEITKDPFLTKRGDCIIAVNSTKGAADLKSEFKEIAGSEGAKITITIEVDEEIETVNALGSRQLSFTHPTDLVVRKSNYICERTLAIRADKAAGDLSRKLVEKLRNPQKIAKITLIVENVT